MLSRPLYASWSGPATVCRRAGSPETIILFTGKSSAEGKSSTGTTSILQLRASTRLKSLSCMPERISVSV